MSGREAGSPPGRRIPLPAIAGCLGACLMVAVVAELPASTGVAGAPAAAIVDDAVRQEIAQRGLARVMVFLEAPGADARDLPALQRLVARAQERAIAAGGRGFRVRRRFRGVPALAGEIDAAGLDRLDRRNGVLQISLDGGGRGTLAQSVPQIGADLLQASGATGQGVTVAVIDTGIDTRHQDLADDLVAEVCFCSTGGGCCPNRTSYQVGPGSAQDDNGHGSHVAGILTSAGRIAPLGVAPDAGIVAVKVIAADNTYCCSSDVVAALDWILVNRPDVRVVNMSLGTNDLYPGECDAIDAVTHSFAAVIGALRDRGVTSFVASGNDAANGEMGAPACVRASVSVGAVWDGAYGSFDFGTCVETGTAVDQVACFSNSNPTTDLFAPGALITSSVPGDRAETYIGTSMASPHAAGCAADLLQAFPSLTPGMIEASLEATGHPVTDPKNGLTFPRIDCLAARDVRSCPDADDDGYWGAGAGCPAGPWADCDEADPARFPGNVEVCDLLDNDCDLVVDEGFDPDGDLVASCRDNCPADPNPEQGDRDADGTGDVCDLDDGVIEVMPAANGTVVWQAEAGFDLFNLYRGDFDALGDADGDGAAEDYGACLAENLATPRFVDRETPPPGRGFTYLVTGMTAMGEGSLGVASSGAPRPNVRDCRAVFGDPPVIDQAVVETATAAAACDFTRIAETRVCALGVPGAQAIAPIVISGSYVDVRIAARVIDPDSTADRNDLREVLATLSRPNSQAIEFPLLDDGGSTAFLVPQMEPSVGEDCTVDPGGQCLCVSRNWEVASGDPLPDDDLHTLVLAFVDSRLPPYFSDCIMQTARRRPLLLAAGSGFEIRVTAGDLEDHTVTWVSPLQASGEAGTFACSGDPCGCCLLVSGDPVNECRGLAGMPAPGYQGGICLSF